MRSARFLGLFALPPQPGSRRSPGDAPQQVLLCSLVAETIDCPGPIFEFEPTRLTGRKASLIFAACFPGKSTSVATCGPGLGVDRVEDVTAISLPDMSAGTVLCIETFEHVFEVRRGAMKCFASGAGRRVRHHVAANF